jgi:ubiquinone/menaquinone biosynthesis C-methylase UbiE
MNEIADTYDRKPSLDWRHLTLEDVAEGQEFREATLRTMAPSLSGKNVLCLASGGGQQSVVFGLLGAKVTVVDISDVQLEQDRVAAKEKGYSVTCHNQPMEDLSIFPEAVFDLVYQAISICFVKDPSVIYRQVARVLKPGGIYRVEHVNPQTHDVEPESWNGEGYLIRVECFDPHGEGDEDDLEYTFTMAQIFNGLVNNGFEIVEVQDDPENLKRADDYGPGSEEHFDRFLSTSFSVVCRRRS